MEPRFYYGLMATMFCTRLFLTHNDTTSSSMTCGPSKWAGKYVHRPLYTGHGASLSSILVSVSLNTNRHIFAAKQDSTIFPANRIWIRHHIHHHFLWRVFPVCKGFEINLKEKMGNIMGIASTYKVNGSSLIRVAPFFAALRKYSPSSCTYPVAVLLLHHQVPIPQHQALKPQQVSNPAITEKIKNIIIFCLQWHNIVTFTTLYKHISWLPVGCGI